MKQYLMPSYGEIMKHALTCKAIGAEVCSSVWCEFVLVKVNMNQLGVILYLNMYVCKFEPIQHVFRQKAFCKESILFHSYTLFYSLQRGQGIFIAINYTHVFSGDPIIPVNTRSFTWSLANFTKGSRKKVTRSGSDSSTFIKVRIILSFMEAGVLSIQLLTRWYRGKLSWRKALSSLVSPCKNTRPLTVGLSSFNTPLPFGLRL